jgi:2-polyprenyl-3-methyl-5-hydroxy-6-metoxy-1,4-benzoquinol methylase
VLCNSKIRKSEKIGGINVFSCSNCDMQFKEITKQTEDYSDYYTNRSTESVKNSLRIKQYKMDARHLLSKMENYNRVNILDIGCSNGLFIETISGFCSDDVFFTGIDVDKSGIECATKRRKENMRFYCTDVTSLDIDEKFDTIIFRGTLQYLDGTLQKVFEKIKTILSPNGKIFIYCLPNYHSLLFFLLGKNCGFFRSDGKSKLMFNERSIKFLAEKYEFEIEELSYPYIGTPYENRIEDFKKIVNIAKAVADNGESVDAPSFAFWGNIMQIVLKNKEDV